MPPVRRGRRRAASRQSGATGRQGSSHTGAVTRQPVSPRRSARAATVASTSASQHQRTTRPTARGDRIDPVEGDDEPLPDLEYLQSMIRREVQQALAAVLPAQGAQAQQPSRRGRRQSRIDQPFVQVAPGDPADQDSESDTTDANTGANSFAYCEIPLGVFVCSCVCVCVCVCVTWAA